MDEFVTSLVLILTNDKVVTVVDTKSQFLKKNFLSYKNKVELESVHRAQTPPQHMPYQNRTIFEK